LDLLNKKGAKILFPPFLEGGTTQPLRKDILPPCPIRGIGGSKTDSSP